MKSSVTPHHHARTCQGMSGSLPGSRATTGKCGDEDNKSVVGFFGGSNTRAIWADMDTADGTIEKESRASHGLCAGSLAVA